MNNNIGFNRYDQDGPRARAQLVEFTTTGRAFSPRTSCSPGRNKIEKQALTNTQMLVADESRPTSPVI